jgi:hypothetical protein
MADTHTADLTRGAPSENVTSLAVGLTKGIRLAATPTFALMALLACSGSPMDGMCRSGPLPPLSGMVPMYLLMSIFHSAPWVKLLLARPPAKKSETSAESGQSNISAAAR